MKHVDTQLLRKQMISSSVHTGFLLLLIVLVLSIGSVAFCEESLRNGNTGDAVRDLQQKLIELHFLSGTADGKFGTRTENALRTFQKRHNLRSDGVAGPLTWEKLNSVCSGKVGDGSAVIPADSSANGIFSGNYSTMRKNTSGSRVRILQDALRTLGFLSGNSDGKYGTATEKAVSKFQLAEGLKQDGIAGKKTLKALETAVAQPSGSSPAEKEPENDIENDTDSSPSVSQSSVLSFDNDYTTIRKGATGERVVTLQKILKELNYLNSKADGKFGNSTEKAVILFQKYNHLTQDGLAGKKTLTLLEKAYKKGEAYDDQANQAPDNDIGQTDDSSIIVPKKAEIHLLHWFNDIKPMLKNGQHILVYDPSTGISWTLRLMSLGRHADAEPLTLQDTNNMVRAFGNKNTWNQKAVYVRLPNGVWTIGSTHDMPHLSGHIKDNGFDGHLCVHFLRDMSEAQKNDPSYGVANQKTIREYWKKLTGEAIAN